MAQSLKNRFELGGGSRLGYPNNPTQPVETGVGPSAEALSSTIHDLYSYDGNPIAADVAPRFENVGPPRPLPSPTQLQAFTGPQNLGAAAAGFRSYNNQSTYDSFVLEHGANVIGFVDRINSSGNTFLRGA